MRPLVPSCLINQVCSEDVFPGSVKALISPNKRLRSAEGIKKLIRETTENLTSIVRSRKLSESDNFFILSLDSLRMVQLAYNSKRELGPRDSDSGSEISLRLIYRHPAIQALLVAVYNLYS